MKHKKAIAISWEFVALLVIAMVVLIIVILTSPEISKSLDSSLGSIFG
ncbi:MAG TPA: hypothetical protein VI564_07405 [Candidatus Nanoarchaeia archaeon]|nr:hypothetical protein [Candidatus Nanoarchaeia archaeon]